ncbi:hypothetical protein EJ04DRAFT_91806 [Polyplosphaeria fusca]|uniref:Uncharacterized protein n=1 Tax=Polyplosphaeria fusca TaxID=682080 RepID=A0A9P4UX54_9PLEO|nr:hypothetical protein EJ04DRAFT_91806 [Polyplosphaeria fusca]
MTLSDNVRSDMRRLMEGDPNETIEVPMIHSTAKKSLRHLFVRDPGVVSHTVSVRKMKRDWYLKHYAKDAEGNYIGTEKPALDAPLVFVPSKSTPEDLLEQVHKVAFGKQHYVADFAGGWVATQAGGGAY